MFGFVLGTVCLIGLVKMARHGRCGGGGCGCGGCGRGWGGGCHGGWRGGWGGGWHGHHHGHGPWGGHGGEQEGGPGPWMFQRFFMRHLFERLETTPGQEKVIQQAVNEAREAIRNSVGELRGSRDDVAKAFGAESFDETALGGAFARQDEAIASIRRTVTGALAKIHDALDSRQRQILADLIAKGPRTWGGRWGGPYRA